MKLTTYNATEHDFAITLIMNALTSKTTDELAITFANGYTVDIFVEDDCLTVNVLRKGHALTESPFVKYTVYSDLESVRAMLELVSKATTDFEVGIAYSCLR